MKHILVTGGAAYVGAILVPKLLNRGYEVSVLDLFLYAQQSVFAKNEKLHLLKGDLRDRDFVKRSLQGIDTVIHLAGISNDPSSDLDPGLTKEVNIEATKDLIAAARDLGVRRFINASSSSVYGIKEENDVTEELCLEPLTVYSESKAVIEDFLRKERGAMVAVSVRSATVCGFSPRMRLDLTVNILTHHAVKKGQIRVFGGVQKRPNIHIEDITDLYAELVETPANLIDGKEFNACGANHTVMEIATLVQDTVGPEIPIRVEPTNDLRSYHISASRIAKELGFVPKRTIEDAIRDVAAAFADKRIADPENDIHYNVRTMKKVLGA
ncbi:MAG: SDR family oxidoreductase [Bdellovibrionales bacterium]|nr:SDR family oxidoreductase [Bdellovibrionales bacterium]